MQMWSSHFDNIYPEFIITSALICFGFHMLYIVSGLVLCFNHFRLARLLVVGTVDDMLQDDPCPRSTMTPELGCSYLPDLS